MLQLQVKVIKNQYNDFDVYTGNYRRDKNSYYYDISEDLEKLIDIWWKTESCEDGLLSGILADYIEDNIPLDTPISLLLEFLRDRLYRPENNVILVPI